MAEDFTPFNEYDGDESIDELIGMLSDAVKDSDSFVAEPDEVVNTLFSNVFEARDEQGVLGNFILVGEIIASDGVAQLVVVTSENLPEWVARGMIMAADDYIATGVIEQ